MNYIIKTHLSYYTTEAKTLNSLNPGVVNCTENLAHCLMLWGNSPYNIRIIVLKLHNMYRIFRACITYTHFYVSYIYIFAASFHRNQKYIPFSELRTLCSVLSPLHSVVCPNTVTCLMLLSRSPTSSLLC